MTDQRSRRFDMIGKNRSIAAEYVISSREWNSADIEHCGKRVPAASAGIDGFRLNASE
jgi:hypothetical protein